MSEELIRRSDAIDVLYHYQEAVEMGIKSFPLAVKAMNDIPTIEPKQGEWIKTINHTIKCCECGAEFTDDIMDACLTSRVLFPKVCPICMARMKGADDE